jgi:hypothetical protein
VEPAPTPTAVRLARELVDGTGAAAIRPELERWLSGSARFRAFATANAAKLRKKLRGATDVETLRDLRLELLVAHRLHANRRLSLVWEVSGARRGGPDFTVSLPGGRATMLEVTRLRRDPSTAEPGVPWLGKLRQLPPGVPNVLVVGIDGSSAAALDVASSVRTVRAHADARDDSFLEARGYPDGRAFYERFLRLGAVVVVAEAAPAEARVIAWRNGSARIAVPEGVLKACVEALRGAP